MSKFSEFKEKLNSVVFMGIGSLLAIIAVFIMFAPGVAFDSVPMASSSIFWNTYYVGFEVGAWPVFVGYMLILLGGLIMGIVSMPIVNISSKVEKICLFTAIASLIAGAILVMCTTPIVAGMNSDYASGHYHALAGPFVAGSFALLSAVCCGVAVAFDW